MCTSAAPSMRTADTCGSVSTGSWVFSKQCRRSLLLPWRNSPESEIDGGNDWFSCWKNSSRSSPLAWHPTYNLANKPQLVLAVFSFRFLVIWVDLFWFLKRATLLRWIGSDSGFDLCSSLSASFNRLNLAELSYHGLPVKCKTLVWPCEPVPTSWDVTCCQLEGQSSKQLPEYVTQAGM